MAGYVDRVLPALLAQALGQDGIKTHTKTGAEGYHQQLDRVGIGQGEKIQVADLGHINTVHQVVDAPMSMESIMGEDMVSTSLSTAMVPKMF